MVRKSLGKIEALIYEEIIGEEKMHFTDEYQEKIKEVCRKIWEIAKTTEGE